ncbi:MAG TPA: DUF6774 domain-containing protein [Anaerovoracaceae bacterium]|nr:DUF6774 domain-containing protein [Anaerovoracaceae bacterium]
MNPSQLTMLISSLAVIISNEITDDVELGILGSSFTRLGNTLTTMSAQRALLKKAAPAKSNGTDDNEDHDTDDENKSAETKNDSK